MAQDIRICFIGDSLVNGTWDEAALGWAGRLCAMAHACDIPVTYYNLGIRRNTSKDILVRWESECTLRLPGFCDGRIVLSCGVTIRSLRMGRCASISRNLARTSERFCAEPSNTPCLWLGHRRLLTTNRMRESKASRLRLLARQKRSAFRSIDLFLRFAWMTSINGK